MATAIAILVGVVALLTGLVFGWKLGVEDARMQLHADLTGGSVEIGGCRYSVQAVEFDIVGQEQ